MVLSGWLGLNHNTQGRKDAGFGGSLAIKTPHGEAVFVCFMAHGTVRSSFQLFSKSVSGIQQKPCLSHCKIYPFVSCISSLHFLMTKHFHIISCFFCFGMWHFDGSRIPTCICSHKTDYCRENR